jgi:tungstate transport system substrate-binding protein
MLAAWLALVAGCAAAPQGTPEQVRMATTTSTENSGLLRHLLPPFEAREGIQVLVLAVGTGQALALGERGEVDILLVHAREQEDAFMAAGHGSQRRDVMWNDFVLLGPPGDPAGIRGESDAVAAMERIAAHRARFVSRGDDSGTHVRELSLWAAAGGVPAGAAFYLVAGQGMGSCLVLADEKSAYILADRGTYLAFAPQLDLQVMVQGDPRLRNPYGAILVAAGPRPAARAEAAHKLLDYLSSPAGQDRIATFRVDGQLLFHPAGSPD